MTRQPALRTAAVAAAFVIGSMIAGCTEVSGTPRPDSSASSASQPTDPATTSPATPEHSIKDVELCSLIQLDDLPIEVGPDDHTERNVQRNGERCTLTVQRPNIFDIMIAGVRRLPVPFDELTGPPDWRKTELTEISGRPAWVGRNTSDETFCTANFGAADGVLAVTISDDIQRDVDPCETVVRLAEIVISRVPPPNEQ